jgi:hypothetical protein
LNSNLARLHRHADLEIPRIIRPTGQRCDFSLGQLGREILSMQSRIVKNKHSQDVNEETNYDSNE